MKRMLVLTFILSANAWAQPGTNLKTIVKDSGDIEREKVDVNKACAEVRDEQQRLMKAIRPEFQGNITIREAVPLEVFRVDNSLGYAAKCVLQFPAK